MKAGKADSVGTDRLRWLAAVALNSGWNWWELVFSIRIVVIASCCSTGDHGVIDPHYLEFKKGSGDCIPPQRISF